MTNLLTPDIDFEGLRRRMVERQIAARGLRSPLVLAAMGKVARGHVTGMSIGYETMAATFEERDDKVIRHLDELKLFEGSVTPFPANEAAVVLGVKDGATGERTGSGPDLRRKPDAAPRRDPFPRTNPSNLPKRSVVLGPILG